MSGQVQCGQSLLLQADFDGELDATQSAELERHRESCELCSRTLSQLQRARLMLRSAPRFTAPEGLREKLMAKVRSDAAYGMEAPRETPRKTSNWRSIVSSGGIGAIAAGLLAFILLGTPKPQAADAIVDNHLRAMRSEAHLIDVVSTEHHTVKPWFAGQIEFAPPVKDMEAFGYPLRGGRVDVVAGRSVAVMVYQAGKHSIDVTVEPLTDRFEPTHLEARGFNIRHWADGEFSVWAISDLNSRELDAFVERWKSVP